MVALIEYSCSDNLKFLVTGGRKCLEKVNEMFEKCFSSLRSMLADMALNF